jgi:adenine deaminase
MRLYDKIQIGIMKPREIDYYKLIDIARGALKAPLVLKDAQILNLFTGETECADIALYDGIIAGVGKYSGEREINLEGAYALPGFIDAHIHIESSMVTPSRFAAEVIKRGVTTVIADPHEIANVSGPQGVEYMVKDSLGAPVDCLFMLPSCVPATSFETSGAVIDAESVKKHILMPEYLGLGEMMNYPGVLYKDTEVINKVKYASEAGKPVDGHAPGLKGAGLNAYVASGIMTEHEASELSEAKEKISRGMYILVREGTAAKNLEALIPLASTPAYKRMMFCSDDLHPFDMLYRGSIDYSIRRVIDSGIDPLKAISMATLNAAECYGLKDRGAIAPGRIADMVICNNLKELNIIEVIKGGKLLSEGFNESVRDNNSGFSREFNCKKIKKSDIALKIKPENKALVIGLIPDSIITEKIEATGISFENNSSYRKICVVERHKGTGNIAVGIVKGYDIKDGAIATSIAHDSHNIIAIGDNDEDIVTAVNAVIDMNGGIALSKGKRVISELPLEIGGLMTDKSVSEVNNIYEELVRLAREMGVKVGIHPVMSLSFLALPVIPSLKITDKGLFDVDKFGFTETILN